MNKGRVSRVSLIRPIQSLSLEELCDLRAGEHEQFLRTYEYRQLIARAKVANFDLSKPEELLEQLDFLRMVVEESRPKSLDDDFLE